ncbi:MAG: hypothetical protein WAV38_31715 [Xanthobacteraceae bacterium]
MDIRTAKTFGRMWNALTEALPEEGRQKARNVILDIIDAPHTAPEDREFWRIILGLETVEERRQGLKVIISTPDNAQPEGGDAA